MAPADAQEYEAQRRRIEELKAEVGTLQYQVNTFEQEREMARLQHEGELRDARRKAEDDFQQRQAAESARAAAERKTEALQAELEAARDEQDARQQERERRLHDAVDEARVLREQLEDLMSEQEEANQTHARREAELQSQLAAAQRTTQEAEQVSGDRETALQQAQRQLAEREEEAGRLEAEVLRLRAHTGDAATMEIIRRELQDQVRHIRALEATNREQLTELRHLRQTHKAVEIVEEEKRSLLRRLDSAQVTEQELAEERLQRQRLESERRAWTAYLQPQDGMDGTAAVEFDSPEAMAKALMEERFRTAELTEKIGALTPEIAQRDADLQMLRSEKDQLAAELARAGTAASTAAAAAAPAPAPAPAMSADKARARLERQRTLAVKEVEYLRAQLQALDAEDATFHAEQFDQHKADRIRELEQLVDQYRAEVATLHTTLTAAEAEAETATSGSAVASIGAKRARPADDDGETGQENEQMGQLVRRARKLQDELSEARTAQRTAEAELAVARQQLATERASSGVRVLSLRANPTAEHEAVKRTTLEALQRENAELLAHIEAHSHGRKTAAGTFSTVPLSVLAAGQREIQAAQAEAASAHKTARRLKEVWAAKSAEFKEAVESTLGWHVTFIPNGKMRVESVFCASTTDEHENSIVFDGERGTMKVGGGPRSAFAQRIDDQIRFWVRDKGCIPGFLAALTLEFYEEQARLSTATA